MASWLLIFTTLIIGGVVWLLYRLKRLIPTKDNILAESVKAANRPTSPNAPKPCKEITKRKFSPDLVPPNLDALIIGSGISGLATGCVLSKAGYKVLVLEQHGKAGGCCHTFKAQKHFEFDTGIHFVGKMRPGSSYYKLLNKLAVDTIDWVSSGDPYDTVTIDDTTTNNNNDCETSKATTYKFGIGVKQTRDMLMEKFPNEHQAITRFFELVEYDDDMGIGYMLGKILPISVYKLFCKLKLYKYFGAKFASFFEIGQKRTVDVLNELTDNDELKSLLIYLMPAIGFDVLPSPWFIVAGVWLHYMAQGSWYPAGGSGTIVRNMIPTILAAGGQVLVRADVREITVDASGRANGVVVQHANKNYQINVPLLISAAGVPITFNKLLPRNVAVKSRYFKYCNNPGASLNLVFVGLNGTATELGFDNLNHHYMPRTDVIKQLERYSRMSPEELLDAEIPFYSVTSPSTKDPFYATRYPGKSVLTLAAPTNYEWFKSWSASTHKRRPEQYKDHKQQMMFHIWEHVLRHYPHLEDKVEYMEMATPLTIEHYIRSIGGSVTSLAHDTIKFNPIAVAELRAESDIDRLFLSGQDIHTGGFTGAFTSGLFCAETILRKFGAKNSD